VVLGVDLHVRDAGDDAGDVGEHAAGGAARRAEGRRELQQRGPLTERVVEPVQRGRRAGLGGVGGVRLGGGVEGVGAAEATVAGRAPDAERAGEHQGRDEDPHSLAHDWHQPRAGGVDSAGRDGLGW